jgi:enoyl-CoA hydratase/carnithine racemase
MNVAADSPVLVEHVEEGVSTITLNRPEKRNAMNQAARTGLIEALDECRESRSKVIVLTGNGPAFCAGIDLKEAAAREFDGWEPVTPLERRTTWRSVQEEIKSHPAVVIAAVNGFALGGGVTLINAADLAIAADEAKIGMPEIGFGTYPNLAGPSTQLRVSQKRAAWMVLTADRIDGATAARWGIVNRSVPLADLMDEAIELAKRVAVYNAVALAWSKQALWEIPAHTSDWAAALKYGEDVGIQIQARSGGFRSGLDTFAAGERNPGQGPAA